MSENCDNNCSGCSTGDCEDRKADNDFSAPAHEMSHVKKVIGIVSGKGGVGKSMITSLLAVTMQRLGYASAILDADVTGPSIPKSFGLKGKAQGSEMGLFPVTSKTGIEIMSVNLLLENDTDPVVWRGPIIGNTVKQFWSDVIWGEVDFMFIDMPPGTGDVALTVFQSVPVDGIIIVTSPQELVSMIVSKAVKMAEMMNIPIIGVIENFSYFKAPDTGKEYNIFGESHLEEVAEKLDIKVLAKMPIEPKLAAACDKGAIELFDVNWLEPVAGILEQLVEKEIDNQKEQINQQTNGGIKMKIAVASEGKLVTEHFGHCENFNIFEAENGKITSSSSVPNPGHKPGFLPNFLNEMGVNVIISGGMGGGAVEIFNEKNIEVITGAQGSAEVAASDYLQGKLKSTGSVCHEHQHEGDGSC